MGTAGRSPCGRPSRAAGRRYGRSVPRLNPPPNWPAPPPGWEPPPGWTPDPAWGPPPTGWQLWLPDPRDGRRANRDAFARVGIVAAAVLVAVMIAQAAMGIFSAYNAGSAFGGALVPWLVVSLAAFLTRRRWNWWAIVGAYLGAWLFFSVVGALGRLGGGA